MSLTWHDEPEPAVPARAAVALADLLDHLLATAGPVAGRPVLVAVDGRSSSGKTTLAARLAGLRTDAVVVHTDDVAWNQAVMDWADLLADGVLRPARTGAAVEFTPPAWVAHGRTGSIDVPAGTGLLLVEGVGVARATLAPRFDAVVWVTSRAPVRRDRNTARIAAGEAPASGQPGWFAEENPFQAAERSWERADVIVDGTPELDHDPVAEVVLAAPPGRWPARAVTIPGGRSG